MVCFGLNVGGTSEDAHELQWLLQPNVSMFDSEKQNDSDNEGPLYPIWRKCPTWNLSPKSQKPVVHVRIRESNNNEN